jgi:hypothetical protein
VVNNINFTSSAAGVVDRGICVVNQSAAGTGAPNFGGSQFNAFTNITVQLNRANTSSIGIEQRVATTPSAATGANSNNAYMNLTVSNTYNGILLTGNATFPDLACSIGNTSPTAFNTIGGATPGDIGGGTLLAYGIRCTNQSGANVFNNEVRNLTVTAGVTCDGIFMELSQGQCNVYRNMIHDLRNTSTTATNNIQGIRGNVATTAGHDLRIYNNFIYGFYSSYTGAASLTRQYKGIYVQSGGGGLSTSTINVDNNNILIDGSGSPNISGTCFEIGTTSGPVINVRNNNFYNATGAQTAPAGHYAWVSTSATLTGNTGSVSNYNNLYVSNTTQGYVGRGNATDYATLANWQAGMAGQDVNSISVDPGYTSTTNLHVSTAALNGAAMAIAWVTVDIDNQARGVPSDIGADEFTPTTLDLGATLLVTPVSGGCYSSTETVTIRIRNSASVSHNFSVNPVTITVNITGAVTATLTTTVNTGTLASSATADYVVGTFNMSAAGSYTFNSYTTLVGDQNTSNDAMTPTTINYNVGTNAPGSRNLCQGGSFPVILTNTGSTNTGSIQWQSSTDGGITWVNETGPGNTSPSYSVLPTVSTWYRVLMCGSLASNIDTVNIIPTTPPVVQNDTVCGYGQVDLIATAPGTINWYTNPVGGNPIYTGDTLTTTVYSSTTYYVSSSAGGGAYNVGKPDNTGGGGQQSSTAYNIFDVTQNCQLLGFYVYPGAVGVAQMEIRNSAGTLISPTFSLTVTAGDVGNRTWFPINYPLTVGTGFRMQQQPTGGVSMYRNSGGVTYPYCSPASEVCITGSSAGGTFYYFAYDWQIEVGCTSSRVPVSAVVLPTAPVTITAGSTVICENDSTALTANSTNANYLYTWTPAATLNSSTGATVMAGPTIATSYIVVADSAGCLATDTVNIAVNPAPNVVVGLVDSLICIGESDTINVTGSLGYIYNWSSIPAGFSSTNDSIVVNPIVTTDYVLAVTNTTTGCTETYMETVVVNDPITLTISNDSLICAGDSVVMSVSAAGGDGNYSYSWSNGVITALDSVSPSANTVYTVTVLDGCTTPSAVDSVAISIAVPVAINSISNDTTVCSATALVLSVSTTGGSGNTTYSWSNGPVTAVDSVTAGAAGVTDMYIVTVNEGCGTMAVDSVAITSLAAPVSTVLTADTTVCMGDTVVAMGSASSGDGNYSYSWSNGPVTMLDSIVAATSGTYFLTVTDGCGNTGVDSVTVNVFSAPVITASNDTSICYPTFAYMSSTVVGGDGNNTYSWSSGGTLSTDSVALFGDQMQYVTVTDGCGNTSTDSVYITVMYSPIAIFTESTAGSVVTFTDGSSYATSWSWNFGDSQTSSQQNPTHTYASNGSYTVTLVVSNSCGTDTMTSVVLIDVGINDPAVFNGVNVYPNPSSDVFNVSFAMAIGGHVNLELFDAQGKLVSATSMENISAGQVVAVDVTSVESGLYFMKITGENSSRVYKLNVQH